MEGSTVTSFLETPDLHVAKFNTTQTKSDGNQLVVNDHDCCSENSCSGDEKVGDVNTTPERPKAKKKLASAAELQRTPERVPRLTGTVHTRRRLNVDSFHTVPAVTPSPESKPDPPIHEIVNQLDSDIPMVVMEAADMLQHRALHAKDDIRHDVAVSGAIQKLLFKLDEKGEVAERALSTLQNLSAELRPDDYLKKAMVEIGVFDRLLDMIESNKLPAQAIATLMNLIIGSEARKQEVVELGGAETLAPLLTRKRGQPNEVEVRFLTINTLTSLAIGSNARKDLICATPSILQDTIETINPREPALLQLNALELIQSLVLGDAERKRTVIELGFLTNLTVTLASPKCDQGVKSVGVNLLKGFAEFMGRESSYVSDTRRQKHEQMCQMYQNVMCATWPLRLLMEKVSELVTSFGVHKEQPPATLQPPSEDTDSSHDQDHASNDEDPLLTSI
eukprot:m.341351 g.341351  ORF g.341351 m.341351 type:complete len:450 (+) comp20047_c0_seq1:384-1733(+)